MLGQNQGGKHLRGAFFPRVLHYVAVCNLHLGEVLNEKLTLSCLRRASSDAPFRQRGIRDGSAPWSSAQPHGQHGAEQFLTRIWADLCCLQQ